MTTNYSDAIDDIYGTFYAKWLEQSADVVGYVPQVVWDGRSVPAIPLGDKFWARLSINTVFDRQSTLSTCEGTPGQKRFTNHGLVFVQLFLPMSVARSTELGQQLAIIARNAFRRHSTDTGVWFRNSRIAEVVPENLFYRINVVAEYEYDELF